jgi:hypothetical protein
MGIIPDSQAFDIVSVIGYGPQYEIALNIPN